MKYSDIIKCVDETIPIVSQSFDFLSDIRSIVVCGNGSKGYIENKSNIQIDRHDFVVRINNFITIPQLTGLKKDCLFAGASVNTHLTNDQFYPEIDFDHIITSKLVYNTIIKYKNIHKYNSNIIYYDNNKITYNLKNIGYASIKGISGLHCIILFMAICKKIGIPKFSIVGFSNKKYYDNHKTSYYYGDIDISKDQYHQQHDWDFQYRFINALLDHHEL